MNQLAIQKANFEFLTKTNLGTSINDLSGYFGDIYEMTLINAEESWEELIGPQACIIPSKYMLIKEGWHNFEHLYLEFVMNGNDPDMFDSIADKDEDDVLESWTSWKYDHASYNVPFTQNNYEMALARDINAGLSIFHLSYLKDDRGLEPYISNYKKINIEDWVNPPFCEVW